MSSSRRWRKLKPYRTIILAGAKAPVAFFAYPDKPGELTVPGATIHTLAKREDDIVQALEALADELGAKGASAGCAAVASGGADRRDHAGLDRPGDRRPVARGRHRRRQIDHLGARPVQLHPRRSAA